MITQSTGVRFTVATSAAEYRACPNLAVRTVRLSSTGRCEVTSAKSPEGHSACDASHRGDIQGIQPGRDRKEVVSLRHITRSGIAPLPSGRGSDGGAARLGPASSDAGVPPALLPRDSPAAG